MIKQIAFLAKDDAAPPSTQNRYQLHMAFDGDETPTLGILLSVEESEELVALNTPAAIPDPMPARPIRLTPEDTSQAIGEDNPLFVYARVTPEKQDHLIEFTRRIIERQRTNIEDALVYLEPAGAEA